MIRNNDKYSLSGAELDRLAELAKLSFSDEEKEALGRDMSEIVAFASKLSEADISEDDCRFDAAGTPNTLRDDMVREGIDREALLASSKNASDGYIRVSKVIEEQN